MFKKETLQKVSRQAKTMLHEKQGRIDHLHVSFSNGNSKIGRVLNVSVMPLLTCGNCGQCGPYCYDIKACVQYKNVLNARVNNTAMVFWARDRYFEEIDIKMFRRKKNKFMRWHVGGEIPDYDYFCRMVEIAKHHPDFIIWTYTKMYHFVNRYCKEHGGSKECIPAHFHIMFSEWDGTKMDNPYNFPMFTCKLKDGNKNHSPEYFTGLYKCPGNCDVCKAAGRGCLASETTYADEH